MLETSTRRAYDNFYATALKFFELPQEEKLQYADENNNNLGFVFIENVREYLKVLLFLSTIIHFSHL
jgi:isopenicillin N synthase-like dioxygenase